MQMRELIKWNVRWYLGSGWAKLFPCICKIHCYPRIWFASSSHLPPECYLLIVFWFSWIQEWFSHNLLPNWMMMEHSKHSHWNPSNPRRKEMKDYQRRSMLEKSWLSQRYSGRKGVRIILIDGRWGMRMGRKESFLPNGWWFFDLLPFMEFRNGQGDTDCCFDCVVKDHSRMIHSLWRWMRLLMLWALKKRGTVFRHGGLNHPMGSREWFNIHQRISSCPMIENLLDCPGWREVSIHHTLLPQAKINHRNRFSWWAVSFVHIDGMEYRQDLNGRWGRESWMESCQSARYFSSHLTNWKLRWLTGESLLLRACDMITIGNSGFQRAMAIRKSSPKKAKKIGFSSIPGRKKDNQCNLPFLAVTPSKSYLHKYWLCITCHPASKEGIWVAQDLQSGEVGLIPRSTGIDFFSFLYLVILKDSHQWPLWA